MKKTTVSFAISGILLFSLQVPTAIAHGSGSSDGTCDGQTMMKMDEGMMNKGMGMGKSMNRLDADEDGIVSKAEFVQAHEDMFDKMDKDDDGELSEDELKGRKGKMAGCMMNQ